MKKIFGGPAIFLDRSDINTDEIIPAKYLTEVTKEALKPYCLEDLKLEGFDPQGERLKNARVIISRENFGCGSSREHARGSLKSTTCAYGYRRELRQDLSPEHVQLWHAGHRAASSSISMLLMALEKEANVQSTSR